jgi:hypothetical protein
MCNLFLFRKTMSYFNSIGHVNLFLNIACIMNVVTKKQRLTKQNPLKVFYYNKIIEVKTLLWKISENKTQYQI